MTEEQIALARRAVACRGWRWMPGMLWLNDPSHPITSDGDEGRHEYGYTPPKYGIPVLEDPATLGCLLALVREAWGDECAGTAYDEFADGWFFKSRVRDGDGGNVCVLGRFRHEAEALVAALEAAP